MSHEPTDLTPTRVDERPFLSVVAQHVVAGAHEHTFRYREGDEIIEVRGLLIDAVNAVQPLVEGDVGVLTSTGRQFVWRTRRGEARFLRR